MDEENQVNVEVENPGTFSEEPVIEPESNSARSQGSDSVVETPTVVESPSMVEAPVDVDAGSVAEVEPSVSSFRPVSSSQPVCYCVYEEVAQGTFYMQWKSSTSEPINNHIMMFIPTKTVPKFKLVNDGGRSELATRVMPDKEKFWSSLCLFVKQAKDYKATFQLFPGWNDRLPYKSDLYVHNGANTVTKVEHDAITLEDIAAVGVAGRSNLLMANKMSKEQFSQGIRKGGYCLLL